MSYKEYITAYEKTKFSEHSVKSSHDIIRELMFQLSNYLKKVAIDINDHSNETAKFQNLSKKETAFKKSRNISKCLSIIYGLQTSLDFDNAPEIATNLFQLYEFVRHKVIKGFSSKDATGVIQASEIICELLSGWKDISKQERIS
tara:strand:+ start:579 stop:1013 length:435 start_codon:yes stop_codon:yes gene_type:complete